ncbi:family 1 encapsulin nanocompartment shell protein [uncultured Paracoccus sp.]|uniref:family 1 encapsulin nanocompartment shell protein n=1 Tax=uncultured Paracoccus sp. TaxID=189685 RepID=UPI00260170B9|nr:family 1 encapsulin nanocompartment shell protein [uncultured Paracoccus sp.]
MDNLHRPLAPISAAAWEDIEEEARRTLRRYLGARRVVDLVGPEGYDHSSVNLGHIQSIKSGFDGVTMAQRAVLPLVEIKVPFTLNRGEIDNVARGAQDSDWQPVKDAALKLATAENLMVFEGLKSAGIEGMRPLSSNKPVPMPEDDDDIPEAVARAVDTLREVGVQGPYALILGDDVFTRITGGSDEGYPVMKHIRALLDRDVIWCPGLTGGIALTLRGGDFQLHLGLDTAIGYDSHSADEVVLYLLETAAFKLQTSEALVSLPS